MHKELRPVAALVLTATGMTREQFNAVAAVVAEFDCGAGIVRCGGDSEECRVAGHGDLDPLMVLRLGQLEFVERVLPLPVERSVPPLRPGLRQVRVVSVTLEVWSALLPVRIANEDLGGYIEDINRRQAAGQKWLPLVRAVMAVFWTGANTIGYFLKAVGIRKSV